MGIENKESTKNPLHLLERYRSLVKSIYALKGIEGDYDEIVKHLIDTPSYPEAEREAHFSLLGDLAALNERFRRYHWLSENYRILLEMTNTFMHTFDREVIYEKAFQLVSQVMVTDGFFIALYQEEKKEFYIPFFMDTGKRYDPITIKYGQGFISQVVKNRKILHLSTSQEAEAFEHVRWGNTEQDTNTALFIPLTLGEHVKGVISAQSYKEYAYSQEDVELLQTIGGLVIHAIESVELYEKIAKLSYHDDLTGLKNRRAFQKDLEKAFQEWSGGQEIILIMMDSDHLKELNDRFGHDVGDMLIQRIGAMLKKLEGREISCYRYAGDEFMVLLKTEVPRDLQQIAREFLEELIKEPLKVNGVPLYFTMSVGVASFPKHASSREELLKNVDQALYFSKNHGKNRITVFGQKDE
ncbi:MAG: GGDEF domain-containing protein [Thermicanus sp.]|nr:GGDEF domain-containing protein [Thermicanus sp.]